MLPVFIQHLIVTKIRQRKGHCEKGWRIYRDTALSKRRGGVVTVEIVVYKGNKSNRVDGGARCTQLINNQRDLVAAVCVSLVQMFYVHVQMRSR